MGCLRKEHRHFSNSYVAETKGCFSPRISKKNKVSDVIILRPLYFTWEHVEIHVLDDPCDLAEEAKDQYRRPRAPAKGIGGFGFVHINLPFSLWRNQTGTRGKGPDTLLSVRHKNKRVICLVFCVCRFYIRSGFRCISFSSHCIIFPFGPFSAKTHSEWFGVKEAFLLPRQHSHPST